MRRAGAGGRRRNVSPAELVAEDAKTAGRVAKELGSFGGREVFDKEGTERLVLAMQGLLGAEEEGGGLGIC